MLNQKFIIDLESSGLNAITNRITCISILNLSTNEIKSFYGESEIKILTSFWKEIDGAMEIYGYNSNSFDFPFLVQRTLIHNIPVCPTFHKIKLTDLRLISTLFFTSYNKAVKGTLGQWSEHFGMGGKETNGEEMIEFYKKGDWEGIKKHCESDINITKKLYDRILNCGLMKY